MLKFALQNCSGPLVLKFDYFFLFFNEHVS